MKCAHVGKPDLSQVNESRLHLRNEYKVDQVCK